MTEVIGICVRVTKDSLFLLDEENDEIEFVHTGIPEKVIEYFNTLVGKKISYYYDSKCLKVKEIKPEDKIVRSFPDGQLRLWENLSATLP